MTTRTPSQDAVRTEGLTKVYPGGVTAVDGLDLGVRRGEILGVLGPNGAGKSTTAGLPPPRVPPALLRAPRRRRRPRGRPPGRERRAHPRRGPSRRCALGRPGPTADDRPR